jgi:glutamate synthase (NADPH) GltB2 subunit (EC 1.4.1.13)
MRGMALMKKIPTFDDLVFLPGTLTRFVIEGYREKCETKTINWTQVVKTQLN